MGDKNTWGIVLAAGEGNRARETGYARAIFINNDGVRRAEQRTAWSRIGDRLQGLARKRDSKR